MEWNFYDINVQIAYLCLTVGTNILFTVLVVLRLLWARWDHGQEITVEHSVAYVSIIAMVVESAAVYSMLGVLFIASFATKSNLSNLIFLSISHVQGIAQLLIIVRVANGRAFKGTAVEEGRNATLMFHATVATDNSDLHDLEDQRTEVVASSPLAPSKKGTVATSVFTSSSIDVDREGAIIAKVQ
ncbi:hypothetical protein DXG01_004983 [Tephrocybe rancida]|nr:hypothetical protein DXG01_004983 [Tephrocybe rancida]